MLSTRKGIRGGRDYPKEESGEKVCTYAFSISPSARRGSGYNLAEDRNSATTSSSLLSLSLLNRDSLAISGLLSDVLLPVPLANGSPGGNVCKSLGSDYLRYRSTTLALARPRKASSLLFLFLLFFRFASSLYVRSNALTITKMLFSWANVNWFFFRFIYNMLWIVNYWRSSRRCQSTYASTRIRWILPDVERKFDAFSALTPNYINDSRHESATFGVKFVPQERLYHYRIYTRYKSLIRFRYARCRGGVWDEARTRTSRMYAR